MLSPFAFWPALSTELLKVKRTLALALCAVAPAVVVVILLLIAIRKPYADWGVLLKDGLAFWSLFILPMTLAVLTALLAQVEHGPRMWDHLLALPVARFEFFVVKLVAAMLLLAVSTALLVAGTGLSMAVLGALMPQQVPASAFPWAALARYASAMWGAVFLACAIQTWIALAFKNFVVPLTVGLIGTFVTLVAAGVPEAKYFPWTLPGAVLMSGGSFLNTALLISLAGGALVSLAMLTHLNRKEL